MSRGRLTTAAAVLMVPLGLWSVRAAVVTVVLLAVFATVAVAWELMLLQEQHRD